MAGTKSNREKRESSRPLHGAYLALALATAALTINFWAWSLISPLGAKYASELDLNPIRLSLLLAVPVLIASLGRIVVGMMTDKIGGKIVFALVCLLTALPVIGLSLANGYGELIFMAIFLGIGGTSFVIGVPFLSAWFPPRSRGLVLGIYSMGNAGTAVSGFLTPRLADKVGRGSTFIIVAGLLIAMAVTFLIWGKNSPNWKSPKVSSLTRFKQAARAKLTWDLSAVYSITFGAFVAFGVYLPVLLKVSYGLSLTDAASRAAGFVVLVTLARPFGGWLSDKVGGKYVVQFALLAIALLAGFVAFQPTLQIQSTIGYLSLAFMLGCGSGGVFALMGRRARPEIMGSTTGIVGAAGGLGGFLPPLVMGFTYQRIHSYTPALILLAVGALAVLIFIHRRFKDKAIYKPV